jgi:hypothetical protein
MPCSVILRFAQNDSVLSFSATCWYLNLLGHTGNPCNRARFCACWTLTPFAPIRFYHPCTIANLVPEAQNDFKRGTIPFFVVSKSLKRLPADTIRLQRFLVGRSVSGFNVCCARHMASGASPPRRCLAHAGKRGGNRV